MVLGWKYLHSMQRFLVGFFGFCHFWQNAKNPAKTSAWDGVFWWVLVFCQKWPKLAACLTCKSLFVSDTQRVLAFLGKNGSKLAACLTKCRSLVPTTSGDEFWAGRLSARDPGKVGGLWESAGILVRHAANFGTKSQILSGTRCVSGLDLVGGPFGAGFTRIPRRIRGFSTLGSIWS